MVIKNRTVILCLVLLGALEVTSDFILGTVTENSTLVHSERITGTLSVNITWNGGYDITRIEILDQSSHGASNLITLIDGGLNESYVAVNIEAIGQNFQIDFIINIYGEQWPPNDFIDGSWTENCILLHNELILNFSGVTTFNWSNDFNITLIQAIDQTNGTGGYVYYIEGGVGYQYLILYFNAKQGDPIHFNITIYGTNVTPNDFTLGTITNTSFLLKNESVTGFGSETFYYEGPHDIVRIEALDQSNGLGGFVIDYFGGVSFRNVILFFLGLDNSREINFIVRIYGEALKPRDYISGNLTNCSELLHRERIREITGLGRFDWSGSSTITRIEALDQSIGDGGEVYGTDGGLQNQFVTLHFLAVIPYGIIDFVVNVYGDNCI